MILSAIGEYIARDSSDHAALFMARIIERTDHLVAYPRSGRVIPELRNQACREIIYGCYRIMYRIESDEIWITGIVHGAQEWKPE
jgi:plasmid stabilization system protein ParE